MAQDDTELEARLAEQDESESAEEFVAQANVSDAGIYDEFEESWSDCWERAADLLDWGADYDEVLDDSNPLFYERFTGGELNACHNCMSRRIESGDKNRATIKWGGEHGETRTYTYQDLYREVNEFATALRDPGIERGDVVMLYMPMVPELPIAIPACVRIDALHNVVFADFSAEALATRINAAGFRLLVTCDGHYRHGDPLNRLDKINEGFDSVNHGVDATVVADRLGDDGFDRDLKGNQHDRDDLLGAQNGECVAPVGRDAENMLFLVYTSETMGQPKRVEHTTDGYLSYMTRTSHAVLDIETEDTYWCSAGIGWITGHSYIVYGPLTLGPTTVMYEGTPDFPNRDRMWELVEKYAVDISYATPTAIYVFTKWDSEYPESRDLSNLRLLEIVGEPINLRVWKRYYEYIDDENCPAIDTWWQTETGGMMIMTFPGVKNMKPGSARPSPPGIDAQIVDTDGDGVELGRAGYLTMNKPWPGMLRTFYDNNEHCVSKCWVEYPDTDSDDPGDWIYFLEDGAKMDEDGYTTVPDRVDDVINVSGHRLRTVEVESAIAGVGGVTEAAVVGDDHEVRDEVVHAYVITGDGYEEGEDLRAHIVGGVEDAIGPITRPEQIVFTSELPKTRSGKIMHRLLEDVVNGAELDNTLTLRSPEIIGEVEAEVYA